MDRYPSHAASHQRKIERRDGFRVQPLQLLTHGSAAVAVDVRHFRYHRVRAGRERERVENNREREFNGFVRPARAWSNAKYSLSSRFVWQTTLDVDDLLSVTKLFPACWRLFDLLRTIVD